MEVIEALNRYDVAIVQHDFDIYGGPDVPDDLVNAILKAFENESILDNAHGFSYSSFRPKLVSNLKFHRATEAYYTRHE